MRGRLVESAVHEILRRVDQSKFSAVGAQSAWECLQERLDGSGMAIKRQAERMIGEQSGCIRPVARGLRVSDRVNRLGLPGKPPRRQSVQLWHFAGHSPAQLQAKKFPEELVVSKPRTLRV